MGDSNVTNVTFLFSCEDAAQQVLMSSVCLCIPHVEAVAAHTGHATGHTATAESAEWIFPRNHVC